MGDGMWLDSQREGLETPLAQMYARKGWIKLADYDSLKVERDHALAENERLRRLLDAKHGQGFAETLNEDRLALMDAEVKVKQLQEELRIARWDADVPIRELREQNERLREEIKRLAWCHLGPSNAGCPACRIRVKELGLDG